MAHITKAAVLSYKLLSKYVPHQFVVETKHGIPGIVMQNSANGFPNKLLQFIHCNVYFHFAMSFLQLLWYMEHWVTYTKQHMEEAIICYGQFCLSGLLLNSVVVFSCHLETLCTCVNRSWSILLSPTTRISPVMAKIAVQILIVLSTLPFTGLAYCTLPFFVSMDPYQMIFGSYLLVKVAASILYSVTGFVEIVISCFVLITYLNFVMAIIAETERICVTWEATPEGFISSRRRRFQTNYRLLQSIRVLIAPALEGICRFFALLTFFGILYGSGICGYYGDEWGRNSA